MWVCKYENVFVLMHTCSDMQICLKQMHVHGQSRNYFNIKAPTYIHMSRTCLKQALILYNKPDKSNNTVIIPLLHIQIIFLLLIMNSLACYTLDGHTINVYNNGGHAVMNMSVMDT